MHITAQWFNDQFNFSLHSKEGSDAFLTVKGCRIVDGKEGPFVGFPATKNAKGEWWRHVWGSDAFQAALIKTANAAKPSQKAQSKAPMADMEDDVPW